MLSYQRDKTSLSRGNQRHGEVRTLYSDRNNSLILLSRHYHDAAPVVFPAPHRHKNTSTVDF